MKDKDEKTNYAVIILVAIVVIVLFTGWFLWHNHKSTHRAAASHSWPARFDRSKSNPQRTTFSKLPTDVQQIIVAQEIKDAPSCVKNGQMVDAQGKPNNPLVDYDTRGFAGALIGCGSGSWGLFAKVQGNWKYLAKTQTAYQCSLLQQYHVPKSFLGLSRPVVLCYNSTGKEVKYKRS